jgi:myo-inositol-hexaphosphate 3-phosphohydrolase
VLRPHQLPFSCGACSALIALVFTLSACAPSAPPNPEPTATVQARGETVPVGTVNDDAADDPAIWRNPADPAASLIVGTDKKAGIYVYGLDGAVRHFVNAGSVNNVDLIDGVALGGASSVLVVASDRNDLARARLAMFRLDTEAGTLESLGSIAGGDGEAYGICLYRNEQALYAFSVLKDGSIHQIELDLAATQPAGHIVRSLKLGSQSEGCAVDARTGRLYVAEEDVGLWRFDARAQGSTVPHAVASVDNRQIVADAEGVTIAPDGLDGGYVIVSSQGDNAFALYALPEERYAGRFRIVAGKVGSVEETDGIDVMPGGFGPGFPGGLFVAQDGMNAPGAQNFKLLAWRDVLAAAGIEASQARAWLSGDHHIHSEFSADYDEAPENPLVPPVPVFGKDGIYSISRNAEKARSFGLSWMVSTDHGGPLHSKVNHDHVYPAILQSRTAVPEVLQFFGMEFDTPAGDHSSLIIPRNDEERDLLRLIEATFSRREAWPEDKSRDEEGKMLAALEVMDKQPAPPVLIANHPSRSAESLEAYGRYEPREFRNWNDTAPRIAVGMEGAPGHQASALQADGSIHPEGSRGGYKKVPTRGGFDPMTAIVGGFWDSMLAEGRRWWITATSDSHRNWRDGGNDFWPGEYSKTYVFARREHADILDGLRGGRVFVTTGDLISGLEMAASAGDGANMRTATLGGTLTISPGEDINIKVSVRDPAGKNAAGRLPDLKRVDLIIGTVTGPAANRALDRHPGARVEHRFAAATATRSGDTLNFQHRLVDVRGPIYMRVRGTSTSELEPEPDPAGEDPWNDLWFYANPVFVEIICAGTVY